MSNPQSFADLGLSANILKALNKKGYINPSPIQQQCISHLLGGSDIIGQAQTGTGKTAAFSLPLIDNIDIKNKNTQVLVLAPTRELAIQVSESMQSYAVNFKDLHILPIYGGSSYETQIKALKKGVQIVVGTPGRVIDHINRKTLQLKNITALVLDEADEMLKMGFIDDVKWVLERLPVKRQIALFSATMPKEIKSIATKFLDNPQVVKVKSKTETATNITQQYLQVAGKNKMVALKRILESSNSDGVIIFARTKNDTATISEQLVNFGYKSQALNGDVAQKERERVIASMKKGNIDIIVATDVAARGIDVPRITHVINYDIPQDVETYVHRIGRTGRAGRSGVAILFAKAGDIRMLKQIERHTKHIVEKINLPSVAEINIARIKKFKENISKNIENKGKDFELFKEILTDFSTSNKEDMLNIATSLATLVYSNSSFLLADKDELVLDKNEVSTVAEKLKKHPQIPMLRFRVEVGKRDGLSDTQLKKKISDKAEISTDYIGTINILDNFSTIDLPADMPEDVFFALQNATIAKRKLDIKKFVKTSKNNKKRQRNSKNNSRNVSKKPKFKNSKNKK